jgi:hypothetical protein
VPGHPIFTDELLIQLGWLTIAYGRLEELLARIISAFENPDDPKAEFDKAFKPGLKQKKNKLCEVFARRCTESGINQQSEMNAALKLLETAAEARNDVVHGLVSEEADELFFVRHGDVRPVTVDEISAVIRGLVFAQIEILKPVHVVWRLGHFDQKPKPEGK